MTKAVKERLQNGFSVDEPDKMPDNIEISVLDIVMYVVAIIGHFVDLGLDINIAVRYFLAKRMSEFGWTLVFILMPAFVNTAVSIRMYAQDKSQQDSISNQVTKRKVLRIFILVLQLAPILRFTDALIYSIKSRRAGKRHDPVSQRMYYRLMLREDSDAALLRIFECFLEAAPQQVLQMSLLFRREEEFTVHQVLSIISSVVGMGWCLAAHQRAIRFSLEDKLNMDWRGSTLQTLWHFLVTLSRITSVAMVVYLFHYWALLACVIHILMMATWLQLFDKSPFCSQSLFAEVAFSVTMGAVYIFTYILPVEGRTRYRYALFYSICFIENVACSILWCLKEHALRDTFFFIPVLLLSIVPYIVGLCFMIVYYRFLHPKVRKGVRDFTVSFKASEQVSDVIS